MISGYGPPGAATRQRWPWGRIVLFCWPVLVCGFAIAMMAPGRLEGDQAAPYYLRRMVYDESDLAALALRGANAELGRYPGRAEEPPWQDDDEYENTMREPELREPEPPLTPRFYLEYPTPTLLLFRLGYRFHPLPEGVHVSSHIQDAHHVAVAYYTPQTEDELAIWAAFRVAVQTDMILMTLAWMVTIAVVARGYHPGQGWGGPIWLAALPGAVFFAINRFDALPTMFTAIAFACLGRGYRTGSGIAFGCGVIFKMYPLLFLPIVVRYLGFRTSIKFVAAFGLTVLLGFGVAYLTTDLEGAIGPIKVQLARKLVPKSWTLYDKILPTWLGENGTARLGIIAICSLILFATKPATLEVVLRRCGIILTVFVALAVFWSPQWIIWFLPLLIPLCRVRPRLVWHVLIVDLTTYYAFPLLFWVFWHMMEKSIQTAVSVGMIYLRATLWCAQIAWLAWPDRKPHWGHSQADFAKKRDGLVDEYWKSAPQRGLKLLSAVAVGEPLFAWDAEAKQRVVLQALEVDVEPEEGKGLEETAAAHQTRTITAMFAWGKHGWAPLGRPIFNLSPSQVVEMNKNRYELP